MKIKFSCFLFISLQFYLLHFKTLFIVILSSSFFFSGLKGVYENVRDGQPSRYYVQVFKNNATYTLSEKFDSKDSAANAFDKMAVSLGRTRNFLNKPENFDTYVKQRDAELDLLVVSIQSDAVVAVIHVSIVFYWFIPLLLSSLKS